MRRQLRRLFGRWLEEPMQDARYGVRSMARQPLFAVTAITIVALATGAAIAVFSLLDALVVRNLPVERPDRLVWFSQPAFSYPIFREVQARLSVFDGLFGWNVDQAYVDWSGRQGELQPTDVLEVTDAFFPTLRLRPGAGRLFDPSETGAAVISDNAWARRFGSDPAAIGRSIVVGGVRLTIVGVTPRGFFGVAPGLDPEVIIPIASRYGARSSVFASTTSAWLHLMARLKDGVSSPQAEAALQAAWPGVLEATTREEMDPNRRAVYLGRKTSLVSGATGYSRVRNEFGDPLRVLMALVALLLAVACASVANLLLARGLARRRELGVRLAIGACRGRIFRQLLTEALVLTLVGVSVGVALASWTDGLLVAFIRTSRDRLAIDTRLGWRTIGFSLLLAVAVSVLSAILPAVRASRADVVTSLKDVDAGGAGLLRRWSAGRALVTTQVALAVVLLAGAALFTHSLARLLAQDTGIDPSRILVIWPNAAAAGYTGAAQREFDARVLERVRATAGIEDAALSWMPPISTTMGNWTQSVAIDGAPRNDNAPPVYFNGVSPRYFASVGMRLRRGRDIAAGDTATSPKVAIVNESLARQFFGSRDPVGHRITIGKAAGRKDLEIIGVVQDAKYRTLQEPPRSIAYLSIAQVEDVTSGRDLFVEARTADLAAAGARARDIVRSLDSRVPVRIETVEDRVRESTLTERLVAIVAGALGIAALILSCAGLYGLLAYAVSQHRREIAIRMALGARAESVLWMVARESLIVAVLGSGAGVVAAVALARFVRAGILFQISPTDPVALAAATAIMLLVAAAAASVPARHAASVDPLAALKGDA